ncbi:MAG: hypothetical protein ABJC04_12835, partial [Verrucomicrobiota bacterium]
MKHWLQEFSFKKSFYERPNQKWICGHACLGEGCVAGPDAQGKCGATAECRPLKKGDRWQCTRPTLQGGPCVDGPGPDGSCCRPIPKCSPVRSLRSRRGLTVLFVLAASLAFVFFLLATQNGAKVLSPGELSFAHASAGSKCADCHEGAVGKPVGWLAPATHTQSRNADAGLCLHCHNVGFAPLQPHSLPEEKLQLLTQTLRGKTGTAKAPVQLQFASFVTGQAHSGKEPLACAVCHKEHGGQNSDLKILSNNQCQSCHAVQFKRFSEGHPEFAQYPFARRTRIIFDHESHLKKHFLEPGAKSSAPASCTDCHQPDLKGGTMVLKPFETVCASCHEEQIKGKGAVQAGIPFISLPRFDDRALSGNFAIGEWPEDADQPMTAFVKLLLSADPELRGALDKLDGSDLSNLPKGDVEKLKAAQQVAWGIKNLVYDLNTMGQGELIKRVEASAGRPLSNSEREAATALMGADVLRTAFQTSFPKLQNEIADYRAKKNLPETDLVPSPPLPKNKPKNVSADVWVDNGGWYSPDGSFTLYYHPSGHSDRFLTFWMNLSVAAEKTTSPSAAKSVFSEIAAPKSAGFCAKCHS